MTHYDDELYGLGGLFSSGTNPWIKTKTTDFSVRGSLTPTTITPPYMLTRINTFSWGSTKSAPRDLRPYMDHADRLSQLQSPWHLRLSIGQRAQPYGEWLSSSRLEVTGSKSKVVSAVKAIREADAILRGKIGNDRGRPIIEHSFIWDGSLNLDARRKWPTGRAEPGRGEMRLVRAHAYPDYDMPQFAWPADVSGHSGRGHPSDRPALNS
jgi:hypothetical protein